MSSRNDDDARERIGRLLGSEEAEERKIMRSRWGFSLFSGDRGTPGGRRGSRLPGAGRPMRCGATSFHFRHSFISKGSGVSDRALPAKYAVTGAAVARQRYIERRDPERPEDIEEDELLHKRSSFGTLGLDAEQRDQFWRDAERRERKNGRILCQLIVELPHEMKPSQRRFALQEFCDKAFAERKLPYWAVVHVPDAAGDERNFHGHILYYDRPGERQEDGSWRFGGKGRMRFPWGTEAPSSRERRLTELLAAGPDKPHVPRWSRELAEVQAWRNDPERVPDRSDDIHSGDWVKSLRRLYAETVNLHLVQNNLASADHPYAGPHRGRRYDPRSYREMGIDMLPGRHLGPSQAALERRNVQTPDGDHQRIRDRILSASVSSVRARIFIEESAPLVQRLGSRPLGVSSDADRQLGACGRAIQEWGGGSGEFAVAARQRAEEADAAWRQELARCSVKAMVDFVDAVEEFAPIYLQNPAARRSPVVLQELQKMAQERAKRSRWLARCVEREEERGCEITVPDGRSARAVVEVVLGHLRHNDFARSRLELRRAMMEPGAEPRPERSKSGYERER